MLLGQRPETESNQIRQISQCDGVFIDQHRLPTLNIDFNGYNVIMHKRPYNIEIDINIDWCRYQS